MGKKCHTNLALEGLVFTPQSLKNLSKITFHVRANPKEKRFLYHITYMLQRNIKSIRKVTLGR